MEIQRKVRARYVPPARDSIAAPVSRADPTIGLPVVDGLTVAEAAIAYAQAGLFVGPVKAGTKNPGSLLGGVWQSKTTRDIQTIRGWYRKWPTAGVFIHTGPSNIVVFDLDKSEMLSELPRPIATALAAGAFQRSRGSGDRGHYIFTTDERLGNAAGGFSAFGDVRAGNGVIIAAPSIHPSTGEPYKLVRGGRLPVLPSDLRGLLRVGGPDAVAAFSSDDLDGFLVEFAASANPERLRGPVSAFRQRVADGESRHGALAGVLPWAFREAKAGSYPARLVIDTFRTEFADTFAASGDGQRSRPGANEFENLVRWAAAQPAPIELAETIWGKTPTLVLVRRWAQEKFITPWSLLGMGLLRALSAVPPSWVLPAIIGSSAPPNLFLALVGDSGTGKGLAESVAEEVFLLQEPASADLYPGKPGSGEGIPKMFGSHRAKQGVVYEYTRALMSIPEVDSLKSLFGRDSSTLSATLRELWSGETLGNDYSGVQNKVLVRRKRYRACMSVGVQPERGGPLFADAAGGLPQRFVFVATQDPNILVPTGNTADLEPILLPTWPDEDTFDWLARMGSTVEPSELSELVVPSFVANEVRAARDRKMRKQAGGLDGHRLLMQEKVALAFAVLHGRIDGFEPQHWELAELFMAHSDAVRDETLTALTEASRAERDGKARAEGRAGVVRDEAADDLLRQRARDRILTVLSRLPDENWMGGAELARALSKPQKEIWEDVIAAMVSDKSVRRKAAASGPSKGFKYRAGDQK